MNDTSNNNPLIYSFNITKSINIPSLLISYAEKASLTLNVNENGFFYNALEYHNYDFIKLIIEYGEAHNIILDVNGEKNKKLFPLLQSVNSNNNNIVSLLIDYAKKNNIILDINKEDSFGHYPFQISFVINNYDIALNLINYADDHQQVLNINNDNDDFGNTLLIEAAKNDNNKMVKLLINYAIAHAITLSFKKNYQKFNPVHYAIANNNTEMVQELIEYADSHNIILDLNTNRNNN